MWAEATLLIAARDAHCGLVRGRGCSRDRVCGARTGLGSCRCVTAVQAVLVAVAAPGAGCVRLHWVIGERWGATVAAAWAGVRWSCGIVTSGTAWHQSIHTTCSTVW